MKDWLKKNTALLLALILISSVCFLFGNRKEGMFIDEVYTYGLSNSYYAPFVSSLKDGDMIDKVFTRQELLDYVSVGDNDRFAAGSVYYNQVHDVHPPLYYWIFNFVSSLTPNHFSKWTGLILDFVFYIITLLLLYKLACLLFGKGFVPVATVLLYGLSVIGLSTMIMIRMYILMTLLSVLMAYLVCRIMRDKKPWMYPALGLTILAGLLTQYYFVFYAVLLIIAYDIYALVKKDYKGFWLTSAFSLVGALLLFAVFPACIDQVFADALVSGGNAVENLKSVWQYADRFVIIVRGTCHQMLAMMIVALIAIVGIIVFHKKVSAAGERRELCWEALVFIVPAALTYILVIIISPVTEYRYVYNLIPFVALTVGFLLHMGEKAFGNFKHETSVKNCLLACIALLCLLCVKRLPPDYLYDKYSDYDALLLEHQSAPLVYMDDNFSSPLTYDMLQLMLFDDFIVTNDTDSQAMKDYVGDSDEAVLFIDISKVWASGYDADKVLEEICRNTPFDSDKTVPLYSNGFSDVYVLNK